MSELQALPALRDLAAKYNTDKRTGLHGYVDAYARYLGPRRLDVRRVLEFGVLNGASAYLWEEYFPNAVIVGVDPQPAVPADFVSDRRHLVVGRQEDPAVRDAIAKRYGAFDLIIDDGGHLPAEQSAGMDLYFGLVGPGGYYVVEDLHTAYWSHYTPAGTISIMDTLRLRVDDLNLRGQKQYADSPKAPGSSSASAPSSATSRRCTSTGASPSSRNGDRPPNRRWRGRHRVSSSNSSSNSSSDSPRARSARGS